MAILLLAPVLAIAQGSLEPGAPPMPSMKTLQQIEPRTPIEVLPYDIAQPGSYYVTGPLFSTNHGIRIFSSDVTVDLMGHTITGSNNTNFHGIHVVANDVVAFRNIVLRNGGVAEFGTGVYLQNVMGGAVRYLTVSQNAGRGIWIQQQNFVCRSIIVENNTVTDNHGPGISVSSVGAAEQNTGHMIRNNAVSGNREAGIQVAISRGVLVENNVVGPQVSVATTYGIQSLGSQAWVVRNFAYGNSNDYSYAASADTRGPTVTTSGQLGTTGNDIHPWANFSR
jgi:hypothetical protein